MIEVLDGTAEEKDRAKQYMPDNPDTETNFRHQTADVDEFFFSEVESVLAPRYLTTESARFFISEVETVLDTRYLTTESAKFFISWDGFFLRN